jgi:membrane protease YdiL (CAAX protease family)
MNEIINWKPETAGAVITIILSAICFAIYWFLQGSPRIRKNIFIDPTADKAWIKLVGFQKLSGFFFLGLIPLICMTALYPRSLENYGLNLRELQTSFRFIIPLALALVAINYFASRSPVSLATYPQMRIGKWSLKLALINSLFWAMYLFAYEFLFRGILFFTCYEAFGFWPATAINIALYSATHIPKGPAETFGTIPYGIILCIATATTGSILVAFVTHLIMALSNDFFSIHHSEEMSY